jgi:hypothetical protein
VSLLHTLLSVLGLDLLVCLVAMWIFAPWWLAALTSLPLAVLVVCWAAARFAMPNE